MGLRCDWHFLKNITEKLSQTLVPAEKGLIDSVKDKFVKARDALTEVEFDSDMRLLLSYFDSKRDNRRLFCEKSAATMKAYFNGQLPLRRRWAHYARVNLLTLGANTTQRTEGFFSKLKAKGCIRIQILAFYCELLTR